MNKENDKLNQAIDALRNISIPQGPSDQLIRQTLDRIAQTQPQTTPDTGTRKLFMKRFMKFAAAAVIVLGVFGGLRFFHSSNSSGVVWAEVVQRVQQAKAFSYQMQVITTGEPLSDANSQMNNMDATLWLTADNRMKMEINVKGLHGFTYFQLPDQKKLVLVWPETKMYLEVEFNDEMSNKKYLSDMKQKDPREWVQDVVNSRHKPIGKTIIDGIEVEGLETTNPAIAAGGNEKTFSRLWVNVETGYPVQLENEEDINDGKTHRRSVIHNFQWNLDTNAAGIEPNIPSDYTALPKGQMVEYTNDGKTRVTHIRSMTHDSQQNPDANAAASDPNIPSDHTAMPKTDEPSAIAALQIYLELTGRYPDDLNAMTLVNGMLPAIKAMGDKILVEIYNLDPNQLKGLSQEEVAKKVWEFCTNQYKGLSPEDAAKKAREFLPKAAQLQKQAEEIKKKSDEWSKSIQSLAMFYITLVQQLKDPAYYGKTVTPGDAQQVLLRWKTNDTTYRVVMGDLSVTDMSSEQLKQIESQMSPQDQSKPDSFTSTPLEDAAQNGKLAARVQSMTNIKKMLIACIMSADKNNKEWPATLESLARQDLVTKGYIYIQPKTITSPSQTIAIYESFTDWGDGINVGFADGHVEYIRDQADFQKRLAQ